MAVVVESTGSRVEVEVAVNVEVERTTRAPGVQGLPAGGPARRRVELNFEPRPRSRKT
ncbi:MAG TPA: hypothetical protein VFT22_03470 [Kofleriaceae bacterium]|nr:hypothetical protein [Kofleriaceae bacterium]